MKKTKESKTSEQIRTSEELSSQPTTPPRPMDAPAADRPVETFSDLSTPAFLLCYPFSYSTAEPNNVWMTDLSDEQREIDHPNARRQFQNLYRFMAAQSTVVLLPTPRNCKLQDLVFVANLGIVLTHLPNPNTVIVSNYQSPPRMGETEVGVKFFDSMGYKTFVPPNTFEGEAELKHIAGNTYIGGIGQRSSPAAFEWMEENFDMKVIQVTEKDPYLYHLDCTIFPITREKTMVCTELYEKAEIAEIEKVTEIVPVSKRVAIPGICNSVLIGNTILNASSIHQLERGSEKYSVERDKLRRLEDIAGENAMEIATFNISEFEKGGAVLSCMVMHLNRASYNLTLL